MGVEGAYCDECGTLMMRFSSQSPLEKTLQQMFVREMESCGRASVHYKALAAVQSKPCWCDGLDAEVRFNPARVRSVMAEVDAESLRHRACFLCPSGLEKNQQTTDWQSPLQVGEAGHYCLRVNPYPIFEEHYTFSAARHERQEILPHIDDLFLLCSALPHYTLFYNGPSCGASAPDHFHFQAIPFGVLPLQRMCERGEGLHLLHATIDWRMYRVERYVGSAYWIVGKTWETVREQFEQLYEKAPQRADEWEPRMNIIAWYRSEAEEYAVLVILRSESRPLCFFAADEEQILISPACVEMTGVAIVADERSFQRLTPERLERIIKEVSLPREQIDGLL